MTNGDADFQGLQKFNLSKFEIDFKIKSPLTFPHPFLQIWPFVDVYLSMVLRMCYNWGIHSFHDSFTELHVVSLGMIQKTVTMVLCHMLPHIVSVQIQQYAYMDLSVISMKAISITHHVHAHNNQFRCRRITYPCATSNKTKLHHN